MKSSIVLVIVGVVVGCEGAEPEQAAATGDTAGAADASDATDATDGSDAADAGDATDDVAVVEPPSFCEGTTQALYDPVAGETLGVYPDDFWTQDATDSPSGVRLHFEEGLGWVKAVPGTFGKNVYELEGIPGFGTSAAAFFRFSAKVVLPEGEDSLSSESVILAEIGDNFVRRVPYSLRLTDAGVTLVVEPLLPLRANRLHAVVVTTTFQGADGSCVAPSAALRGLLTGQVDDPKLLRLIPRFQKLLSGTRLRPDDISSAAVFTTQDPVADDLVVAEDIRSRTYAWKGAKCDSKAGVKHCEVSFDGRNYRDKDDIFAGGEPTDTYTYPVSVWMPDSKGPFPTVLFAHGIGGTRNQAGLFAEFFADLGMAVVSLDAVQHADHPGGSSGGGQADVLGFFAIDLAEFAVKGRVLRDNWRQSAWDKLQLLTLFEDAPDIDGDGTLDIDLERVAFFGVSLGGIMGPEVLALTDRVGAAVLNVCGGRLTSILRDSAQLSVFATLAAPGATEGEIHRFFEIAQTLIEPGDPVNYAGSLFGERLPGAGERRPNLLFQVAIGDEVIPNTASWSLARSLGVPHLAPVATPVQFVVPEKRALPLIGNVGDGASTAGLFQFDRVRYQESDKPEAAGHQSTPGSFEAVTQSVHFLQTWFKDGEAEILDPYAETKTPKLGQ